MSCRLRSIDGEDIKRLVLTSMVVDVNDAVVLGVDVGRCQSRWGFVSCRCRCRCRWLGVDAGIDVKVGGSSSRLARLVSSHLVSMSMPMASP